MTRFGLLVALATLLVGAFPIVVQGLARRAVRRAPVDRSAAWFGAALETQWAVLAFWATWFFLCAAKPVHDALAARIAHDFVIAVMLAIAVFPPLALSAWAQWRLIELSHVVRSTRTNSLTALKRLLRPVLALSIGLVAFGLGPALMTRGVPPIPLLLGCILCAIAAIAATRTPAANETPSAVTSGELRDRIVAIAARAGIKVRQFYVMPQTPARLANAFAAQNNSVLITDYLLAHLDRDEVDAVMAHELAHLRRQDPQRMVMALFGVSFAAVMAWFATHVPAAAAATFVAGMLAFLALCRRFEYGADAGALELGARGEALITGLARLARLNDVPMRWSRALEWTLTHPSLERRARAVARRASWAPGTAESLLDVRSEPERPYELPPALAGEGKIFSTALKVRLRGRVAWLLLLTSVLVPAAVLAVLAGRPELPRLAVDALALIAAIAGTAGVALLLSRFPHRIVRGGLAQRLRERGLGAHVDDALLVGLTPGSDARVIEGFYVWDAGFLKLAPGHLDYAGEETSFSMAVGRVQKLDLVSGPPALRRSRVIRVTWLDDQGSWCTLRLFAIEPARGSARGREIETLFERLDAWRRAGESPVPLATRISFAPPRHHEITSIAPRNQVTADAVIVACVLQFILALVASTTLGLPLAPWMGAGWFEMFLAAVAANLALMLPPFLHREPARIERRSEIPGRAA